MDKAAEEIELFQTADLLQQDAISLYSSHHNVVVCVTIIVLSLYRRYFMELGDIVDRF